jgi:hypothetical protein
MPKLDNEKWHKKSPTIAKITRNGQAREVFFRNERNEK